MEVLLHDGQDLHGAFGDCLPPVAQNDDAPTNPNFGGGAAEKTENGEIWLGHGDVSNGDHHPSLFYAADDFPPLPEFPCMSSSSSTSSTPAPATTTTAATSVCSSSSSAASWAALKSDAERSDEYGGRRCDPLRYDDDDDEGRDMRGMDEMDVVADCMNVMDDFDCMGLNQLIEDSNEIWDPTPLFDTTTTTNPFDQFPEIGDFAGSSDRQQDDQFLLLDDHQNNSTVPSSSAAEDLGAVFLEWLKSNKEAISAEDLRSIKIKKSTIESAAKRLGGGKEGMKQLLKLILQWVQHHRLHKYKRESELSYSNPNTPILNPIHHDPQACFNPPPQQAPWINPYGTDPSAVAIAPAPPPPPPQPPGPSFTSMVSYIGGHDHHPYAAPQSNYNHGLLPPDQYHMLDGSVTPWGGQLAPHPASYMLPPAPPPPPPPPPAHMHYNTGPDGSLLQTMAPQGFAGYVNQYNPYQFFPGPGDGMVRMGSSATKEARKKRMARQRRVFTHHHRNQYNNNNLSQQHGNGSQHQMSQGGCVDPNARVMMGDHDGSGSIAHGGWVYWPQAAGGGSMMAPPMMGSMYPHQQLQPYPSAVVERPGAALAQGTHRQSAADKKQGFKTEKNLKFLLQKVLKQSDVGNLGRIVLPKKEAETHLPELEARDGIPISMEDIGTSRVWNMRYRFWPNNKSRMYLLENTGDFVRSNGLQEGDFIVIYSDVKCGKYMIRGVKVRPQQQGSRPEVKKPSKAQKTQNSASPADSALSPLVQRQ